METRHERRAVDGEFDPRSFYNFYNTARANVTLSSGIYHDIGGSVSMTEADSLSSSNWQLYYQQGRYFIRNYDYGEDQLGLTESERAVPSLMRRSGALGQQWLLTRSEEDGGWMISNGLLGNGSWLSLTGANTVPAMQASSAGAVWDIQINPSAGSPQGSDLYIDVDDFEVASSSSTSALPSPTLFTTHASSIIPSTTPDPSSLPLGSAKPVNPSSPSLTTGAIIGIAIGAFAFVLIIALIAWSLILRRRKLYQIAELPQSEKVVYAHRAELENEPVVHVAQEKNHESMRFEMG